MPLDTVSDELSVTACETFGLSASPHAGPGPRLSSFGVGRGHDLRDHRFLDRKATLARLLRDTEAGILFNEHVAGDGPTVFEHACRLGAEGIVSKRIDGTYRSGLCPVWFAIRPASLCIGSAARSGIDDSTDPRAVVKLLVGPSAGGVWRRTVDRA